MYGVEQQELILRCLLSDGDTYARCQNILSSDYFDVSLKPTVKYVKEYTDKYRAIPTFDHIKAQTGITLEPTPFIMEQAHKNAFLDLFEGFCRHRALELAIYKAPELLNDGKHSDVEIAVKNAIMISLQKNIGTDYWADPKGRLNHMRNRESKISSGWKILDEVLAGGFDKGALNFFAGSSNMGKSLFLANIMVNWSRMGLNTVYFTLEMPEDQVAYRIDSMETQIPIRDIFSRLDDVELKVRLSAKKAGARQIKYMPQGSTTNDIAAYLKEYTIQSGITPQAIVVDYLDLLHPNAKNINLGDAFTKDKLVCEEIRGLAHDMGLYLMSASQLGRSATTHAEESNGKPEYNQSHIAGGISKINTADTVFTIYRNKKLEDECMYRVQCLKSRTSSGAGRTVYLGYDPATLTINDVDQPDDDIPEVVATGKVSGSSEIMDRVKAVRNGIKERNIQKSIDKQDASNEEGLKSKKNLLERLQQISQ